MPLSNRKYRVFIFPYESGWAIGLDIGHYGVPLPKREALDKAFQYARERHVKEVAVFNRAGELIEVVKLPVSEKMSAHKAHAVKSEKDHFESP